MLSGHGGCGWSMLSGHGGCGWCTVEYSTLLWLLCLSSQKGKEPETPVMFLFLGKFSLTFLCSLLYFPVLAPQSLLISLTQKWTLPFVMDLITEVVSHFHNGLLSPFQDVFVAALFTQRKVGQEQTAALLFECGFSKMPPGLRCKPSSIFVFVYTAHGKCSVVAMMPR